MPLALDAKGIAIAAAGVIAGIGGVATLAVDECVDVIGVASTEGKLEQRHYRICGEAQAAMEEFATGKTLSVAKQDSLALAVPAGVSLAWATASPVYRKLLPDSKQIAAEEVDAPCACADARPKAALCEVLVRAPGDAEGKWMPAPARTTLQPGQWRGEGCLPSDCWETNARESCGGPGCLMRWECATGKEPDAKPVEDPAIEVGEVKP